MYCIRIPLVSLTIYRHIVDKTFQLFYRHQINWDFKMKGENWQKKLSYRTCGLLDGANVVNLECCVDYYNLSGDDKALVRQKSRNQLPDGPWIPDFWTQWATGYIYKDIFISFSVWWTWSVLWISLISHTLVHKWYKERYKMNSSDIKKANAGRFHKKS